MSNQSQKRKNQPSLTNEYGKVLPQAQEIEEAILGALMVEKDSILKCSLSEDDFYKAEHALIFRAIISLSNKMLPIDMLTVCEELRKLNILDDAGGPYYLAVLTGKVASASHLEYHCSIIKEKSLRRKIIALSANMQENAFSDDTEIDSLIENFEKDFTGIATGVSESDSSDMSQSIYDTLKKIEQTEKDRINGIENFVSSGLDNLNSELNGGFRSPNVTIIGARPSMGKTQLAVKIAQSAGDKKHVCFCSLEMKKEQLITRMITEDEGINFYNLKTGRLTPQEWELINKQVAIISKLNLYIADKAGIEHLNGIKSFARKMRRENKLDLLIIDYLGLIKSNIKFQNRDLEIGHITRDIKSLAKELDIPIILLAQLSRPQKGAIPKQPDLEDLRESGNIEQDADEVIFIHRPSYYDSEAIDSSGQRWEGRGKLIIAKNREGERGKEVLFKHDKNLKKIIDHDKHFVTDFVEQKIHHYEPNTNFLNEKKEDEMPF